jgi:predicted N-acetyltransferase YhbS
MALSMGLSAAHLSPEFFERGMRSRLATGEGLSARVGDVVVGSIFFGFFAGGRIATIGPFSACSQGHLRIGSRLLELALSRLRLLGAEEVRLVHNPSSSRALALYLGSGFELIETAVALRLPAECASVYAGCVPLSRKDLGGAVELGYRCFGVSRTHEIERGLIAGTAYSLFENGQFSGYCTGVGLQHHAVATTAESLVRLIRGSIDRETLCFIPLHDTATLCQLLGCGARIEWFCNVMSTLKTSYGLPHAPALSG